MSTEPGPTIAERNHDSDMQYVDDSLIGQIWHDLDRQVTREQIRQVACEIADAFRSATITAFVPIFIRRQTRAKLETLVDENRISALDGRGASTKGSDNK